MFRTGLEDDRLAASVIVRVTYDLKSGRAIPSPDQEWTLHKESWESEFGPMEHDNLYRLGGVDILVFGNAVAPHKRPVTKMEVKVNIKDKLSHRLLVIGNRVWEKSILGMSIGAPEPFIEMPMTLYNAYGGKADWDELEIPYGNNPHGKGYYYSKNDSYNKPLPNIEDPLNMVQKWDHHPDPVGIGCCPMNELRVRGNVEFDDNDNVKDVSPRFYNTAFPQMIIPEIISGEKICIEGMTPNEIFTFEVPKHNLILKVSLGDKIAERELKPDQVGIIPAKQQAFITYRFPFNYAFIKFQKRKCEIYEQQ